MYGTSSIKEGLAYEGYCPPFSSLSSPSEGEDPNRVIRKGSTAIQYWGRSAHRGVIASAVCGSTQGRISEDMFTNTKLAAVPAVVIY